MELKDILSRVDHTLLSQSATWAEIQAICDDGVKYGCGGQDRRLHRHWLPQRL